MPLLARRWTKWALEILFGFLLLRVFLYSSWKYLFPKYNVEQNAHSKGGVCVWLWGVCLCVCVHVIRKKDGKGTLCYLKNNMHFLTSHFYLCKINKTSSDFPEACLFPDHSLSFLCPHFKCRPDPVPTLSSLFHFYLVSPEATLCTSEPSACGWLEKSASTAMNISLGYRPACQLSARYLYLRQPLSKYNSACPRLKRWQNRKE